MLGLDKQRNEFDIVISDVLRCHYDFDDFYAYLNKCGATWYLIRHNKDINEQGELKREHIHLVLVFPPKVRKWCKTILVKLSSCLYTNVENIQIQEVDSLIGCIQYLIHKNHKDKFQYDISEVETNDTRENLQLLMEEDLRITPLTTKSLSRLILDDKLNRYELIQEIGIGSYQHYRPTINDLYDIRNSKLFEKRD